MIRRVLKLNWGRLQFEYFSELVTVNCILLLQEEIDEIMIVVKYNRWLWAFYQY